MSNQTIAPPAPEQTPSRHRYDGPTGESKLSWEDLVELHDIKKPRPPYVPPPPASAEDRAWLDAMWSAFDARRGEPLRHDPNFAFSKQRPLPPHAPPSPRNAAKGVLSLPAPQEILEPKAEAPQPKPEINSILAALDKRIADRKASDSQTFPVLAELPKPQLPERTHLPKTASAEVVRHRKPGPRFNLRSLRLLLAKSRIRK